MLWRSLFVTVIFAAISFTSVNAMSPKKVVLDTALAPDCSNIELRWAWQPATGQASVRYSIHNLTTGVFQGLFIGPSISEAASEANVTLADVFTSSQRQRYRVGVQIWDASGNVLISSQTNFTLPCSGP